MSRLPARRTYNTMSEAEWWACAEPDSLLWSPLIRSKISDRKLRLFACACCRRMWNLLADDRSRLVIEVAEKYADGLATHGELEAAREGSQKAVTSPIINCRTTIGTTVRYSPGSVASSVAASGDRYSPRGTAVFAAMFAEEVAGDRAAYNTERKEQAVVFRDLIGNPFRPVTIDSAWLAWNDATIPKIAHAIYDNRAFDRLPIFCGRL